MSVHRQQQQPNSWETFGTCGSRNNQPMSGLCHLLLGEINERAYVGFRTVECMTSGDVSRMKVLFTQLGGVG
jgi:hypothetical protein